MQKMYCCFFNIRKVRQKILLNLAFFLIQEVSFCVALNVFLFEQSSFRLLYNIKNWHA